METADIHIENRVSFVMQYSRFLYVASNLNLLKTHELANPVVHMNDKVPDIEFFQLFDRDAPPNLFSFDPGPVVPIEDLMICQKVNTGIRENKSLIEVVEIGRASCRERVSR